MNLRNGCDRDRTHRQIIQARQISNVHLEIITIFIITLLHLLYSIAEMRWQQHQTTEGKNGLRLLLLVFLEPLLLLLQTIDQIRHEQKEYIMLLLCIEEVIARTSVQLTIYCWKAINVPFVYARIFNTERMEI